MKKNEFERGEIVIYSADGDHKIEIALRGETLWLSQKEIAELFITDRTVITRHLNNIFKSGELEEKSNVQKMHIANSDRPVSYYSLDVIISVGYRVKSKQGTQFRIWANRILQDYKQRNNDKNHRQFNPSSRLIIQCNSR